jgi:hypothetical protein
MSNKMSDVFDLPVGDSEFTLVAMAKSTYMSMDKAAVIAINAYDANQDRIAELEKERDQILNSALDSESNYCKLKDSLPAHNLEQQAKALSDARHDFTYSSDATCIYVDDLDKRIDKLHGQVKALKDPS